jgi:putative serine protease PepD
MTFDPGPWSEPEPAPASASETSVAAPEPAPPPDGDEPASVAAPAHEPTPTMAPTPGPAATVVAPAPRRAGGIGIVVAAAMLSAVLAGGGTTALLLATRPAAAPAAGASAAPVASQAASAAPASTVVTRLDGADAIAAVAAAAEPSVVTIGGTGGRLGSIGGTGIIVSADGLILTTTVVAPGNASYDILLSNQHQATATVVATDAGHGLVLLRANTGGLTPARLGSGAKLTVGQLVVAVGSPLGEFTDTVTSGIVSGLDRAIDLQDPSSGVRVALGGLIQTDAAINAGSSGGPLLDAGGTVVGIIATSASDGQGIGFAIPIAAALELIARAEA